MTARQSKPKSLSRLATTRSPNALRRPAIFKKHNERKKRLVRIDPPPNIAATLKQRRYNLKLPPLVAVVNCPQFRANGQIMGEPGYNPKTGIFYAPRGVSFPPVPANPTAAEVKAALERSSGSTGRSASRRKLTVRSPCRFP